MSFQFVVHWMTEAKFLHNCFWHNFIVYNSIVVVKIQNILILQLVAIADNIIRNNYFYNHSKQAIKLTHILKVNFDWKFKSILSKKCSLHSENTIVTIYSQCLGQISKN